MKIMRLAIAVSLLVFLLAGSVAFAQEPPILPHAFYGSVQVYSADDMSDIRDAPVDTVVTAEVGGEVKGSLTVTTAGQYGGPAGGDPKLIVQDTIPSGAEITFYVDGYLAEEVRVKEEGENWKDVDPEWVATFTSGEVWGLDLRAKVPAAAAGGGGGGGGGEGPDTTPPIISGVLLCPEGVTETTADICWITDESSTSQVEYWASPSMLSPLDETMVTVHQVQLTGLAPCTTYTYLTMSRDAADNLAVSDEHTFTTLGEVPATAFTSSDLSISPGEVQIGETVNISAQVTNTGNCPGSYTVTLKINDAVEATEDIIVNAGASEEVTFTTAKDVAGSYSVDVNGLSGSFIVKEEVVPPPPPPEEKPPLVKPPINWFLIGGIIAGVVIVGLLIFFLARRRAY